MTTTDISSMIIDNTDFEEQVESVLNTLRIRTEARKRFDAENLPAVVLPPIKRLDELLAEPDTEQQYRIDQVAPADARIMLNAQWKAGKTTVVGNLVRALVDHEPFLGRFTVHTPANTCRCYRRRTFRAHGAALATASRTSPTPPRCM